MYSSNKKKRLPTPMASSDMAVTGKCSSKLRVYVYDFPEELDFIQIAKTYKTDCREKNKCGHSQYTGEGLLAQFSLELILHDFFAQSCLRTLDPSEAHLFYVPFYNDVEYRHTNRPDKPSRYGQAILDIMEKNDTRAWEREFKVTGKWWKRRGGADHILTMPAPVTGFRHPKGVRGWGHYLVQLEAPIFLSVELSRSFIYEYPHCSAKNVVLPYPIPGRDWHNGKWRVLAERLFGMENSTMTSRQRAPNKRPILAYYSGGNHGCPNVRSKLNEEVTNDEDCMGAGQRKVMQERIKKLKLKISFDQKRGPTRQVAMSGSVFCACPEGDSPSAKRQYDAVLTGCIPVVVSNEAVYAYSTENGGMLEPKDFSLRVDEGSVVSGDPGLLPQLRSISPQRVEDLQAGVHEAAHYYRYYAEQPPEVYTMDPHVEGRFPDGGALAMLVAELEKRVGGNRAHRCAREREGPHFELKSNYCGTVDVEKEVGKLKRSLKGPVLEKAVKMFREGKIQR